MPAFADLCTTVIPALSRNPGAGDGFPSARERRAPAGAPTIVIPATAGIHGGGAGDGFPSARERRVAAGAPTIVIPATAGKSAAGGRRWVPVCTGTTGAGGRTHNRHSRDGGNPRWGGRRWVPVSTGTTGAGGRTHNRYSRDGGNPPRGAGDSFSSARERRAPAGAPTIVIPATAGIRRGGPAIVSRLHGNDGRRRAHPQSSGVGRSIRPLNSEQLHRFRLLDRITVFRVPLNQAVLSGELAVPCTRNPLQRG